MPKLGMAPVRRKQLVDAAIASIHEYGLAEATVARIAGKARMSAGSVHHYFYDKDDLLFETMRVMLKGLRQVAVRNLANARDPRARIAAVIEASFDDSQFSPAVMSAWLALYGSARHSDRLAYIVTLYHRRLRSNLLSSLRGLMSGREAERTAEGIAAMIDGLWLRCALSRTPVLPDEPRRIVHAYARAVLPPAGGEAL